MERNISEAEKAAKGCLIIIVLGIIIWSVFSIKSCITSEEKKDVASTQTPAVKLSIAKLHAYIKAEECIKELLKSPASANFPYGDCDLIPQINDSTYLITSYVDAQNSFGANLRNYYRCVVVQHENDVFECQDTRFIKNPH